MTHNNTYRKRLSPICYERPPSFIIEQCESLNAADSHVGSLPDNSRLLSKMKEDSFTSLATSSQSLLRCDTWNVLHRRQSSMLSCETLVDSGKYKPHEEADIFDNTQTLTFTTDPLTKCKVISEATVEECIKYMMSENMDDSIFITCFIHSYKMIITTEKLFELLNILFSPNKPSDMNDQIFFTQILVPMRRKICSFIDNFIGMYPRDFASTESGEVLLETIKNINEKMYKKLDDKLRKTLMKELNTQIPIKIEKIKPNRFINGLFLYSPDVFAQQMTVIQMNTFQKIPMDEFLPNSKSTENICKMIHFSNHITQLVKTVILQQMGIGIGFALYYFINVVNSLLKNHNFDGVLSVMNALQSEHIHKLKNVEKALPKKIRVYYHEYIELVKPDDNFKNLREAMNKSFLPCIPAMALTKKDLLFSNDGNITQKEGENVINFYKLRLFGVQIMELYQKQQCSYDLKPCLEIEKEIAEYNVLHNEKIFLKFYKNLEKENLKKKDLKMLIKEYNNMLI